jgi:hypothetical protein
MHKLRLRSRSAAQREREAPQNEHSQVVNGGGHDNSTVIGNSQQTISSRKGKGKEREKNTFKASIRHVGADNSRNGATHGLGLTPAAGASSSLQTGDLNAKLRPQLSLPAGNDFRTSLILVSSSTLLLQVLLEYNPHLLTLCPYSPSIYASRSQNSRDASLY